MPDPKGREQSFAAPAEQQATGEQSFAVPAGQQAPAARPNLVAPNPAPQTALVAQQTGEQHALVAPQTGEQHALVQQAAPVVGNGNPYAQAPAPEPEANPYGAANPDAIRQDMARYNPEDYQHSPWTSLLNGPVSSLLSGYAGTKSLGALGDLATNAISAYTGAPTWLQASQQTAAENAASYTGLNSSMSGRVDTNLSVAHRQAEQEDQLDQQSKEYWAQMNPALARSSLSILPWAGAFGSLYGAGKVNDIYNYFQDFARERAGRRLVEGQAPSEHMLVRRENPQIIVKT